MAERHFLVRQAASFASRTSQLRTASEGLDSGFIDLYEMLATGLQDCVSANSEGPDDPGTANDVGQQPDEAPKARRTKQEFCPMPHAPVSPDPFHNETELLKQITLFQGKISALGEARTPHKRAMRSIYATILDQCRASLDELRANSVSATGTNG